MNELEINLNQLIDTGKSIKEICDILHINPRKVIRIASKLNLYIQLKDNSKKKRIENLLATHIKKLNLSENLINEIKYDVEYNNLGQTEIFNKYTKSINSILKYVVFNYNLIDKLKENNQLYKSNKLKQIGINRRNNRVDEYYEQFYNEINNLIINQHKMCSEISKLLQIRPFYIRLLAKKMNLETELKLNAYYFNKAQCQANSAKNKISNTGRRYHKIQLTKEMEDFYNELLLQPLFNGAAKRLFHAKFKTSAGVWPQLQLKYGELKRHPNGFLPGKDNLMYGKEPSYNSGHGITGHLMINGKKIFFRSSLELRIYLYLMKYNIQFSLSNHVVEYEHEGKLHHYHQDIVIDNVIYEIKPINLIKLEINKRKFAALEVYCKLHNLKCNHITEKTYNLIEIDFDYMLDAIDSGIIIINEKQLKRLFNIKL